MRLASDREKGVLCQTFPVSMPVWAAPWISLPTSHALALVSMMQVFAVIWILMITSRWAIGPNWSECHFNVYFSHCCRYHHQIKCEQNVGNSSSGGSDENPSVPSEPGCQMIPGWIDEYGTSCGCKPLLFADYLTCRSNVICLIIVHCFILQGMRKTTILVGCIESICCQHFATCAII